MRDAASAGSGASLNYMNSHQKMVGTPNLKFNIAKKEENTHGQFQNPPNKTISVLSERRRNTQSNMSNQNPNTSAGAIIVK